MWSANRISFAIPSAVPMPFIGTWSTRCRFCSGLPTRSISVAIGPGWTEFTRMWRCARSIAAACVRLRSTHVVALHARPERRVAARDQGDRRCAPESALPGDGQSKTRPYPWFRRRPSVARGSGCGWPARRRRSNQEILFIETATLSQMFFDQLKKPPDPDRGSGSAPDRQQQPRSPTTAWRLGARSGGRRGRLESE
jgi:hypothetical protein